MPLFLPQRFFQDRLQKAIEEKKFHNVDNKARLSLWGTIELGYALGLYDRKTRNGLRVVVKIRNKFAHSSDPLEFDHEKVAAQCRGLDAAVQDPDNLRERYLTYLRGVALSVHRRKNVMADIVKVDHKDDPVFCPRCDKKAQKENYPLKPMPPDPKNTQKMDPYLGLAYCEEHDDTFSWYYMAAQTVPDPL